MTSIRSAADLGGRSPNANADSLIRHLICDADSL
jgi:hypothetical protein